MLSNRILYQENMTIDYVVHTALGSVDGSKEGTTPHGWCPQGHPIESVQQRTSETLPRPKSPHILRYFTGTVC